MFFRLGNKAAHTVGVGGGALNSFFFLNKNLKQTGPIIMVLNGEDIDTWYTKNLF